MSGDSIISSIFLFFLSKEAFQVLPLSFLSFKLLNKNDTVIISISNRISKPVKIVNGMIQTSKSDKENHGIGLNNIMTIVKKYDGDARMRYKDGWFYYTAIL